MKSIVALVVALGLAAAPAFADSKSNDSSKAPVVSAPEAPAPAPAAPAAPSK